MARFASEATGDSKRIRVSPGCEGRHDNGAEMGVEFIRRDNDTGSSLTNLAAAPAVRLQPSLTAPGQLV